MLRQQRWPLGDAARAGRALLAAGPPFDLGAALSSAFSSVVAPRPPLATPQPWTVHDLAAQGASGVEAFGLDRIRNFGIIAHIDHGKSTLADRLLELSGNVNAIDKASAQLLDSHKVTEARWLNKSGM
jgi:hypothetical protein